MIYCDTLILVAALTTEAKSHIAKPWLLAQQRRDLAVNDWCVTKFANAITGKHRRGDLDAGYRAAAEYAWNSLRGEFTSVAVTEHLALERRASSRHRAGSRMGSCHVGS